MCYRVFYIVLLLLSFIAFPLNASCELFEDSFEVDQPGLDWTSTLGSYSVVEAGTESRLSGIPMPASGDKVLKVAEDDSTSGINLVLGGGEGRDMSVQAWVFCEGNSGAETHGGYQGLVARASYPAENFVRLTWDPDHSEPGDIGDGWVKLQAYDGSSWDYLGIDFSEFGSSTNGYILNGSTWESGWHLFMLVVHGDTVEAYIDNMETPLATGTLSLDLRAGQGGFYVYTGGDYAGYFDEFVADVTPEPTPTPTPPADFDIIIRNGDVYPDGDSTPLQADIGITGDRIEAIGDLSLQNAHRDIDATGLVVVPGFIDAHTHADSGGAQSAYIRQGVTTLVTGNCGGSPSVTNVGAYYDSLQGTLGPNYIGLIGHNNLRAAAGLSGVTPTTTQMNNMKNYLQQGLEAGAFGLSTGLIYATGYNSTTEEIIELAGVVADFNGVYASHMRSEMEAVLEAVDEAIRIGHESGCRVQISHVKCAGPSAWGKVNDFLAKVDTANAVGDTVYMDQYPYTASQTTLNVLLPSWALSNWIDAVSEHREELEADVLALINGRGGADRIYIISGTYRNQYLSDVATNLGKDPEDVMIDNIGPGGGNGVYHMMQEDDVQTFMPHPRLMVGSDGPTSSHPRGAGTFPRFWGHYARDLEMFNIQEAVQKTSTLAARQFRLLEQQRGALRPGFYADITILNPDTIIDRSTFESPTLLPTGIKYVLINGEITIDDGGYRSTYNGQVLRLTESVSTGVWLFY